MTSLSLSTGSMKHNYSHGLTNDMSQRQKRIQEITASVPLTYTPSKWKSGVKEKIGFDLGGTIFQRIDGRLFLDHGALRVIRRLVTERFDERSYIVSKVDEEQKKRAMAALKMEGLLEITGIPKDHVEFCAERCDKAPICEKLCITHFVDDRPEVLAHMEGIVQHRFLIRGIQSDYNRFRDRLEGVVSVDSWSEIEKYLLK
jgi:hypothetical protein